MKGSIRIKDEPASPLGQGERKKVRGWHCKQREGYESTLTLPLSLPKGEAPLRTQRIAINRLN